MAIDSAAERMRKRRARSAFTSTEIALQYPDPYFLPQCITPCNVWFFSVSRPMAIILGKNGNIFGQIPGNMWKLGWSKILIEHKRPWVFYPAVSAAGKSSGSFSYRWTQYGNRPFAQLLSGLETGHPAAAGPSSACDFGVSDEQKSVFLVSVLDFSECDSLGLDHLNSMWSNARVIESTLEEK